MAYNETGKKATNKYRSKFDLIQIRLQQGQRDIISRHAESVGESINAFITRAIKETMENDLQKTDSEIGTEGISESV